MGRADDQRRTLRVAARDHASDRAQPPGSETLVPLNFTTIRVISGFGHPGFPLSPRRREARLGRAYNATCRQPTLGPHSLQSPMRSSLAHQLARKPASHAAGDRYRRHRIRSNGPPSEPRSRSSRPNAAPLQTARWLLEPTPTARDRSAGSRTEHRLVSNGRCVSDERLDHDRQLADRAALPKPARRQGWCGDLSRGPRNG